MPANPIQRKTRNAFLAGMLIMLLIAIIVIVILGFVVFPDMFKGKSNIGKGGNVYAYRLTASVKSGEQIPANKIEKVKMLSSDLPTNYVPDTVNVTAYKSKLDLQAGTILSTSLLYENEKLANSARLIEFNMLTLP